MSVLEAASANSRAMSFFQPDLAQVVVDLGVEVRLRSWR